MNPKDKQDDTQEIAIPEATQAETPPEGFSADEWSRLSPMEKEGIVDSLTYTPDEETSTDKIDEKELEAIAETDEEKATREAAEAEVAKNKDEEDQAAAAKVSTENKSDDNATVAATTDAAIVTDEDLLSFRPTITPKELEVKVEVPADMLREHNEKLQALREELETGDITRDEYEDKRDELKETLADWKAEQRDNLKEAARSNATWKQQQEAFFAARPDYTMKKNAATGLWETTTAKGDALFGAFDRMVEKLHANNPLDMRLLIKADRLVRETLGLPPVGKNGAAAPTPAQKKIEVKPPADKDVGVNLGDLPAAGQNVVGDGWAAVDKLPPKQLEAWLAKQTDAVRDAYLNALTR